MNQISEADFFRFKSFNVKNVESAMKISTDSVIIGAWAFSNTFRSFHKPFTILDIGTGTGVIAMIAAFRTQNIEYAKVHLNSNAPQIIGIDIDKNSVLEAHYNFQHSPWANRLNAHLCSVQLFGEEKQLTDNIDDSQNRIDYIITNPPYFINSLKNPSEREASARHTNTLSFADIINNSKRLLTEGGKLALILPPNESKKFLSDIVTEPDFHLLRKCSIYTKKNSLKRVMMEFQFNEEILSELSPYTDEKLIIESEKYRELTKDLYL
ncbi:MAG: methyltransferase domain-containing protein [Bacteroidales bacterium]